MFFRKSMNEAAVELQKVCSGLYFWGIEMIAKKNDRCKSQTQRSFFDGAAVNAALYVTSN